MSKLYRPEDTYAGNLLGTLEALDSGITTLLDWSHNLDTPAHSDAAVDALATPAPGPSSPTAAAPHVGQPGNALAIPRDAQAPPRASTSPATTSS